jgi:hypothetical protein
MFLSIYLYKLKISENDEIIRFVFQSLAGLLVDKVSRLKRTMTKNAAIL